MAVVTTYAHFIVTINPACQRKGFTWQAHEADAL